MTTTRTSLLPERSDIMSELSVNKGYYGDVKMVALAYVDNCAGKTCKIFALCPYEKVKADLTKCRIMLDYIREVGRMLHDRYGHELSVNADKLQRVGLHLLPLYRILIKLQIEEISVTHPAYNTDKGIRKIDPVYKEIRETLKSISTVFRELSLSPPPAVKPSADDVILSGREGKGAYSSLFGDYDGSMQKPEDEPSAITTKKPKLFVPAEEA